MQLLTQYLDPADASAANQQLRAAGVLCQVRDVDPHVIQPSKSGTRRIGLWVVFDDQFDDAVALLQDPSHQPERPLSEADMQAAEAQQGASGDQLRQAMRKPVMTAVGALLLLVLFLLMK